MTQIVLEYDSRAVTPAFAAQFDALICDPPYAERVHRDATSQSKGGGARHRDLRFDSITDADRKAVALAASNVRRWGAIYSDVEGAHLMRDASAEAGAEYIRSIPWVRWSMPVLNGDRPAQGFEILLILHAQNPKVGGGWAHKKKRWNGSGALVSLEYGADPCACVWCNGEKVINRGAPMPCVCDDRAVDLPRLDHKALRGDVKHKAEKPLDQCLDLVSWFSDPGEKVLDLYAGHGTVGRACQILGRDFVGLEIAAEWVDKSNARFVSDLTKAEIERVQRWLDAKDQVAEATGAAAERAERRAADKRRVRAMIGAQP